MSKKEEEPRISISQSATGSKNVTQIGYAKGDVHINQTSVEGSDDKLAELFAKLEAWAKAQAPDQQEKAEVLVEDLKEQVGQGDQVNEKKFRVTLRELLGMAPDMGKVAVATLASPAAGAAEIVRLVAEKAQEEAGKTEKKG